MDTAVARTHVTILRRLDTNSLFRLYDWSRVPPPGPETQAERELRERSRRRATAELRRRGFSA